MNSRHVRLARSALLLVSAMAAAASTAAQSPVARSMNPVSSEGSDIVWTIEAGSYAGLKVALHVGAALGAPGRREHFWRVTSAGGLPGGVVGWRSTRYPIPIAFRHDRSSGAISPSDSSAFWTILGEMSRDFGMELFRPTSLVGDPPDVIVVDLVTAKDVDGLSRVTWTQSGELFDVRVTFRDAALLHDAHVVIHEMMHALGFGHATEWRSVVNLGEGSRLVRPTPEDVAYAELAMRSRVTRERADTRRLVALAVARESSRFRGNEGYPPCDSDMESSFAVDEPPRIRALVPVGLLTVVSACAPYGERWQVKSGN